MLIPPLGFITANFGDIPFIPELIFNSNITPDLARGNHTADMFVTNDELHLFTIGASAATANTRSIIRQYRTTEGGNLRKFAFIKERQLTGIASWGGAAECVGLNFSADGTKMVLIRKAGAVDTGHQFRMFALSTPYDIDTAVWDSVNNPTYNQGEPYGLLVSPDGTKAIVVSNTAPSSNATRLVSYNLSTPWDFTTAVQSAAVNIPINGTDRPALTGVFANDDGTVLYIPQGPATGSTHILKVTLGAAFDVTSIATKKVSPAHLTPNRTAGLPYNSLVSVSGKNDLYVLNGGRTSMGLRAERVALDDEIDTYGNNDLMIRTMTGTGENANFSADGTKLFLHNGATNLNIVTHNLSVPFDTNAPFTVVTNALPAGFTSLQAITFSADGTKLFAIMANTPRSVVTYNLSTPWTILGASLGTSFDISAIDSAATSLAFSADGMYLYIGNASGIIRQLNLSVAYDVTTITNPALATAALGANGRTMFVRGTSLYRANVTTNSEAFMRYTFGSPTDVTTLTLTETKTMIGRFGSFMFALDHQALPEKMLAIARWSSNATMATPVELDTPGSLVDMTFVSDVLTGTIGGLISRMAFSADGTKMYFGAGDTITQHALSVPFSPRTAWFEKSRNASGGLPGTSGQRVRDFYFRPDGTRIYQVTTTGAVYQFPLSTPWDIATRSNTGQNITLPGIGATGSLAFSSDGTKLFALGAITGGNPTGTPYTRLHAYSMSSAWDITTATKIAEATVSNDLAYYLSRGDNNIASINEMGFNADGTKLYLAGQLINSIDNIVIAYDLTTPWDLNSLEDTGECAFHIGSVNIDRMTMVALPDNSMVMYVTNEPFNISGVRASLPFPLIEGDRLASVARKEPLINRSSAATGGQSWAAAFNADGTRAFISSGGSNSSANNRLHLYGMKTPYKLDDSRYLGLSAMPITNVNFRSMVFASSGTRLYGLANQNLGRLHQLDLSTPYSLPTILDSGLTKELQTDLSATSYVGIYINPTGTKLYVCFIAGGSTYMTSYTFGTPGNITTLTYDGSNLVMPDEALAAAIGVSLDGTKLFVQGSTSKSLRVYTLGTPYDLMSWNALEGTYEFAALGGTTVPLTANSIYAGPDAEEVYGVTSATTTNGYFWGYHFTQPPIE